MLCPNVLNVTIQGKMSVNSLWFWAGHRWKMLPNVSSTKHHTFSFYCDFIWFNSNSLTSKSIRRASMPAERKFTEDVWEGKKYTFMVVNGFWGKLQKIITLREMWTINTELLVISRGAWEELTLLISPQTPITCKEIKGLENQISFGPQTKHITSPQNHINKHVRYFNLSNNYF